MNNRLKRIQEDLNNKEASYLDELISIVDVFYLLRVAEAADKVARFTEIHNKHPDKYSNNWQTYFIENVPITDLIRILGVGSEDK